MNHGLSPQAISEIVQVLQWIADHPAGRWADMGELFSVYERWRDIIKGDRLLDNLGTMTTVPGLSSFGRVFLLKGSTRKEAEPKARLKGTKLAEALAILAKNPERPTRQIAKEVGCSSAYLAKNKSWRVARAALKDTARPRAARHLGPNMDEYADSTKMKMRLTCPCGDEAGADSNGNPLVHDGKPRCRDCWAELQGG